MQTLRVITAANERYLIPLSVMMISAARSLAPTARLKFTVLTSGFLAETRYKLSRYLDGFVNDIEEKIVDVSRVSDLRINGHVSVETYFRLLAPECVPDAERVLYLDCDLVVRHSLLELFNEDLNGHHLLAVPHASPKSASFASERGIPSFKLLGIPGDTTTFNAGVMMLNLEAWRRDNTTSEILKYLRAYRDHVLWWDQDGLNAILHNKWRPLAAKWNVMTSHFAQFANHKDSTLDASTFESVRMDPAIVHFSFVPKPWEIGYSGPFADVWRSALEPLIPHLCA